MREKEIANHIEQVWQLSDSDLSTATSQWQSLQNAVYTRSEYTRMKYDLLSVRIRDKNDMLPSSVDSIKKIAHYMEQHGTGRDIMRAYYYLGSIYEELRLSRKLVGTSI